MKKSLSVILSLVMIISAISFMPFSASATDDGVAPSEITVPSDGMNEYYGDMEQGAGYICIDDPDDDEYGAEIVNLFHGEEVTAYKGVTYDLKTNTLTLDNIKGAKWSMQCDQMLHLKIVVKGNCVLGNMGCWETYPVFSGTGTLTLNSQIDVAATMDIDSKEIAPMTVSNTVTLKISQGTDYTGCGNFSVVSDSATYNTDNLIKYSANVSAPMKWKLNGTEGGPSEDWLQLSGIRAKTVFEAKYLLKKKNYERGDNENYYVYSISHVGNDPYTYHYISHLTYKDGCWIEKDDENTVWNKDYLFERFSDEEIAALPSSLVDKDGNVTAYLSTQSDYGNAYVKDNRVYVLNTSGRYRNLIVNPSYPAMSKHNNDITPKVVMKVVRHMPELGVNLVDYEDEFVISNAENYEAAAAFMKEQGYDKLTALVKHPYYHSYALENETLTFSPKTVNISKCTVSSIPSKTYTGKAIKPTVTVKYSGKTLKSGTDYTVSYKDNTKVGTATVTITGKGSYSGTKKVTFKINKAANPMTVKAKTKTVKYSDVKKKNVTVTKSDAMTVSKAQGTVTYSKSSGDSKITIDKKTGKITVKKGLKNGTYKVKIKVKAAGNTNYKSLTKTVTVTIKVK